MPPKNSRVTNVLVPGEQPAKAPEELTGTAGNTADLANAGSTPPAGGTDHGTLLESDTGAAGATAAPALDVDALRAQIRAEEMGKLQDELAQQLQAASTVVGNRATPAPAAPRSKSDYRNMRATDIDPTTLTAPVMTLDGYLCPVAPEKK